MSFRPFLRGVLISSASTAFDSDASAYITAVETADGQALEDGVKTAINDFVVGCKSDGIWTALKASCILAGARTLNGAIVPLVGTAPTNVNFVSGDYTRKTGPKGNGTTKYLNTNRANNADPQNNNHNAVWVTEVPAAASVHLGAGGSGLGSNNLLVSNTNETLYRSRQSLAAGTGNSKALGLVGMSRSVGADLNIFDAGAPATISQSSTLPTTDNLFVFARNNGSGTPENRSDGRIAFYSIGESLDLAALDARVSALMTALDGAIA